MYLTAEEVSNKYPLHWLVWNNRYEELQNALDSGELTSEDKELKDPRGRTPLLLAITLTHVECVKVLLQAHCDVNCEKDGWTAVQEATTTENSEILALVLTMRDFQRQLVRSTGIPDLLAKLSLAPDFYVEMKWEFTSWVPLVSRLCPSDTYKIYKRGANVRVDTTLVGFENNRWQRGNRTYLFRGQDDGACLVELDHDTCTSVTDTLGGNCCCPTPPSARALRQRFSTPVATNYLDTDKICFERTKGGIWGWRQDKTEMINGYECKVWSANNVELVSRSRAEHVAGGSRALSHLLPGLLTLADEVSPQEEQPPPTPPRSKSREELRPVTWEEYFSDQPLNDRDIGRPKDMTTKIQKFKATLWLCEDYPLELQEQLMPILNLMASISSPHFGKLKDFIQMQLPSGFPVKIEIPLFHVLNARITFGNIFARDTPVLYVDRISEGDRLACIIDDEVFTVGKHYNRVEDMTHAYDRDDDGLLEYAIQQSLMEAGTHEDQVDVWEALRGVRPATPRSPRASPRPRSPANNYELDNLEERQLQQAIAESLAVAQSERHVWRLGDDGRAPAEENDDTLAAALYLSEQEHRAVAARAEEERRQLELAVWRSVHDQRH